jgi:proteasome beta subunit
VTPNPRRVAETRKGGSRPRYDAADDGSATDGPDMTWQMFPVVVTVTKDGYHRLPASESADYAQQVVDGADDSARRAARPTAFRQPG